MTPHSTKRLGKIAAGLALAVAFLLMASVFSPERSRAGNQDRSTDPSGDASWRATLPPESLSTNPHEGLPSLGSLESHGYIIRMYSTKDGPRYSIYDQATGEELAVLMTLEVAHKNFPEIGLPSMSFTASPDGSKSNSSTLMLAEPDDDWP
ncbi:MAG: hypothetical protein L0Y44_16065 [Phycisphaerales bacterium]|nr:hypothetical protein [Phycisphaerales bacterium]MCI0632160.1 hypothetical protein [Phycisphaerales bacterium]MCI0675016.1 hypothetical protein [Phycisphaerales bacterium]